MDTSSLMEQILSKNNLNPDASISAYCRRVAVHPVKLPDGRMQEYAVVQM